MRILTTTTAALLAGAFLLTGCATQDNASTDARLDRIESALVELQESNQQLADFAERLDRYVFETEDTGPSTRAYASSLMSQLQTLRSQIELYKNQHNDRAPDLVKSWYQLTTKTNVHGEIGIDDAHIYGPYLSKPAVNPFTQSSKVTTIDNIHSDAGWAWDAKEQMLFAVVSEEVAEEMDFYDDDVVTYNIKRDGVVSSVRGDLAVLRNAIDLYATEHRGEYPSFERLAEQLTQYTSSRGVPAKRKDANYIYGPYIRTIPDNPITGAAGFSLTLQPQINSAWAYDPTTGQLFAVIPEGSVYEGLRSRLKGDWVAPNLGTAEAAE